MTDWDKNKRIYECLREIYIITNNRDEFEVLGERSEPSNEEPPNGEHSNEEPSTLEEFSYSPSLFKGRGPEEIIIP